MKILISAAGKNIENDNIDTTFHWSSCFLIIDTLNNSVKSLDNTIKNKPREEGNTINRLVKIEGVEAIITYEIGPKAFKLFNQNGVKIYQSRGKIVKAINQFEEGKLTEITKEQVSEY